MGIAETSLEDLIPEDLRECEFGYIHVFDAFEPTVECWVKSTCCRPWCRPCEARRVWKLQQKIKKYLDHNSGGHCLWILTRSVRNDSALVPAFNSLRAAQVAWAKQSVREKSHPLRDAVAWIATTEIKYSAGTGYNVHEHMVWVTPIRRLTFTKYHETWDRAAGFGGAHINLKPVTDPKHAANYIAKYLSKGTWGGLSRGRAYLVREALRGRNRIQSKRGTLPPKAVSGFCFCCVTSTASGCDGEGERPWAWDPPYVSPTE